MLCFVRGFGVGICGFGSVFWLRCFRLVAGFCMHIARYYFGVCLFGCVSLGYCCLFWALRVWGVPVLRFARD